MTRHARDAQLTSLSRQAAEGDRVAFRLWVEALTPVFYALGLRYLSSTAEAEDVVQETCIRAWRNLPTLRDHERTMEWGCSIVRAVATDRLRQRSRRRTDAWEDLDAAKQQTAVQRASAEEPGAEAQLISEERRKSIRQAVLELPEKHRVPLLLREADGMTCEQIASALGCPVGTVESRLHRARAALKKKLETKARWEKEEAP